MLSDTLTAEHDYRGRFRREAQVAAGLQHPNLVSVYDYDAGDRPYLVMEYIEGGDLAAALEAGRPPPPTSSRRSCSRRCATSTPPGSCTATSSLRTCSSTAMGTPG